MAFTSEEIRDNYLEEITRYCPKAKKRGVWTNTVVKRGLISEELHDHIERKRGEHNANK